MVKSLLFAAGAARPHRSSPHGFRLDALEPRQLLAVVAWDGGGDNRSWNDPLNWSADVLPSTTDDARIGPGSGDIIFSGDAGFTQHVRSIASQRPVRFESAVFAALGDMNFGAGFNLAAGARLSSTAGRIQMSGSTGSIVTIAGEIRAASIILDAGPSAVLLITGTLDASSTSARGGTIDALAHRVVLDGSALLDASGPTGGGTIRIGGDYQGRPSVTTAHVTYVGPDTHIRASALTQGDGGRVIVWADTFTGFYGKISARGAGPGASGGFIETSAREALDTTGEVDATAPLGQAGTWLLDPRSVTVSGGITSGGAFAGANPTTFTPSADNANVSVTSINTTLTSGTAVFITTGNTGAQSGSISVNAAISVGASAPGTLTLRAAGDILINANITIGGTFVPTLNLFANDPTPGPDPAPTVGNVLFSAGVTLNLSGGTLNVTGVTLSTPTTGSFFVGNLNATMTGDIQINGSITANGSSGLALRAGTDGIGNLSFAAAGININSNFQSFIAGDGSGGAGAAATANLVTNSPIFRGSQGSVTRPNSFTFRQDASITDANIPLAASFGAAIAGMDYTIQSDDGSVTVASASKVNGTTLRINAAANTTINAPLAGGTALLLAADIDNSGVGTAFINASLTLSSLTAQGANIVVANGTATSASNNLLLNATSSITIAGNLHAVEGLFYAQAITITLSGALSANGGIELVGGPGGIAQTTGSITANTFLAASTGPISLPAANNVNSVALSAQGDLTYNNTDTFSVDLVNLSNSLAGASSISGITTLTTSAGGSINILRTVHAEIRVVIQSNGASTSAPAFIDAPALLLRGGGVAAQFTLSTSIQSFASDALATLNITDTDALFVTTVAGIVGITAPGRDAFLTTGGLAGIGINASINLSDGRLQLTSAGAVTQTTGSITAGSIVLVGNGSFNLASPTNNVVNLAAGPGTGSLTYVDADALFIATIFGFSGIANRAAGVNVTAGGNLSVNADITSTSNVVLRAGAGGTGILSFGLLGVDISSNSISLIAGDGLGGAATATVNAATNSPTFRSPAGGGPTNPASFVFRQDATITDAMIPALARFGGGNVAGMNYTIESSDGGVTITTAAKVANSNLILASPATSTINVPLSLASLLVNGTARLSAPTLAVSGNTTFTGNLSLLVDATITAANLTFNGTITDGATPRSLTANATGATVFSGAVDIGALTTGAGGTTVIAADILTANNQTYIDAVTVSAAATLATSIGIVTFASTLAAAANNLAILAAEINFTGGPNSVSGTGQLRLAPGVASGAFNIFSIDTPTALDLTVADIAALANGFFLLRFGRVDGTAVLSILGGNLRDPAEFTAPSGSIQVSNNSLDGIDNAAFTFVAPTIQLSAPVRTTGQPITFNGAVILTAASNVVDSTAAGAAPAGANITFTSTIDGSVPNTRGLTISPGASGLLTFSGAVGAAAPLGSIAINGRSAIGAPVSSSGIQTYSGPVILTGPAVTTFTSALVNFNAGLDASVAGAQGVLVVGTANFAVAGASIPLRTLSVTGPATFSGNVNTTGDIQVSSTATLAGPNDSIITLTTSTGAVRFLAALTPLAAGEQGLAVTGNLFLPAMGAAATPLRSLLVAGATTITGGGSIRTSTVGGGSGDQTFLAAVTLQFPALFDSIGGNVAFLSTVAAGANSLSIRAAGFSAAGNITGTNALTIEPATPAGNMLLAGADGPGGALDLSSATLARFVNGFSSITFGRADGSGTLTIASAYAVSDPTTFRSPIAPGRIIVNGVLSGTPGTNGSFNFIGSGSTTILNADVRTPGQTIGFNDSVLIGVPLVTIDTTNNGQVPAGADILFFFALGSEAGENNSLTLRGGTTGTTLFTGPVGTAANTALNTLTTDAGGLTRVLASVTAGFQAFNDAVRLEADATFTGLQINFAAPLNAQGTGVDASFAPFTTEDTLNLTFGAPVGQITPLASIATTARVNTNINTALLTATNQTYAGPVALGASPTVTGSLIAFNSGITGNSNNLIVNASNITTFGGTTSGLASLFTDAPGQTFFAGPALTATGNIILGDAVQILTPTSISSLTANLVFASSLFGQGNNFTLSAAEINFLASVGGTGIITLEQASLGQNFNIAHATEGGGDALDITAAELALFQDGFETIEFGKEDGAATMDIESFTFDASVEFTMNGDGGQIAIQGDVATSSDNSSIGVRGNGSTTHLFGNLTTRGGAITIDDSLIIQVPGVTLDSTAGGQLPGGPIFIRGRINSAANLAGALTVRAGISSARFDGPIGNLPGGDLGALDVIATGGIALNSSLVRTIGQQTYTGEVTLGPTVTLQTQGSPITFNSPVSGQSNLIIGPGTGAVTFGGAVGGTTTLASLTINSGSTRIFNGAVSVGVLTVFGGSVAFNGLTNINTGLLIAGTLGGSGTIAFDLPLTWVGGDMLGTGTTLIRQTGALVISGGPKTLSRRIENAGSTYWTDGSVNFAGGAFVNLPTGQFFAQSTGSFTGVSGNNTFDNQGFVERSGGVGGTASLTNLAVINSGQISLVAGDLAITPAGPANNFLSTGVISLASSSTLAVIGNLVLPPTSRVNTVLAGTGQGQFGRITVTGLADINSTLAVTLAPDFLPSLGQSFQIISAGSVNGTFTTTFFPAVPGRRFTLVASADNITLLVGRNADFNGDGFIDPDDLAEFITAFFSQPPDPRADFNGDGFIDPDDLSEFITAFFGG